MLVREMYQEADDSTVTHNGQLFSVNKILRACKSLPTQTMKVSDLQWILQHSGTLDDNRVERSDVTVPVVITDLNGQWVVVDGAHRLTKAVRNGVKHLPAKVISPELMQLCIQ